MAFEIAKAGWLMRESSFLKRWKKNWFILYRDGLFKYFEDDHSSSAEEVVIMRTQCQKMNDGLNVTDVTPPAGYSSGCLLKLKLTDGTWNLCADSPDDMSAWKFALEEARYVQPAPRVTSTRTTTVVNAGYPVAPGTTTVYQVPTQPGTTQYVMQPAAQTIYVSDPYNSYGGFHTHRHRRHCGCCHGRGVYGPSWWW